MPADPLYVAIKTIRAFCPRSLSTVFLFKFRPLQWDCSLTCQPDGSGLGRAVTIPASAVFGAGDRFRRRPTSAAQADGRMPCCNGGRFAEVPDTGASRRSVSAPDVRAYEVVWDGTCLLRSGSPVACAKFVTADHLPAALALNRSMTKVEMIVGPVLRGMLYGSLPVCPVSLRPAHHGPPIC
jgi:hypothetical protein